jgi:large subunit ribosomal protein L21
MTHIFCRAFRFDTRTPGWYTFHLLTLRRCIIYAVIETGNKQYTVRPGDKIKVERLDVAEGKRFELGRVLAVGDGDQLTLGKPVVEGASVVATATGSGLGDKTTILKFKSKVRYTRKQGHRQPFTEVEINSIVMPGAEQATEVAKPRRRTKKEEV